MKQPTMRTHGLFVILLLCASACSSDDNAGGGTGGTAGSGGSGASSGTGGQAGSSGADSGTPGLGELCTLNPDNCAEGYGCTPNGLSGGGENTGHCRKKCTSVSECQTGELCHPSLRSGASLCVPVCKLWGSECPSGYWCAPILALTDPTLGSCLKEGTAALGESCTNTAECVANAICLSKPGNYCHQMCDADHPCTSGGCDMLSYACY